MCVEWKDVWEKSAEDIIAYKVCRVENGKYLSSVPLHSRIPQNDGPFGQVGKEVEYAIGSEMEDSGYGFYMVSNYDDADEGHKRWGATSLRDFYSKFYKDVVILEVLIPAGTVVRNSWTGWLDNCINARKIKVLGEV